MKFITFGDHRIGLLKQQQITDLFDPLLRKAGLKIISLESIIRYYPDLESKLKSIENESIFDHHLSSVTLRPPISNPSKIICVVDNYLAHGVEFATDIFPKPIFFLKPSSTLLGSGGNIILPESATRVDYELELALVIGKEGYHISSEEAFSHVFGYTIFLDISARDYRTIPYSWFSMKGWDTFGPIGPAIITSDEIKDPQNLQMKLWVNGELKMNGNSRDMIFKIPQLIEAASEVTTLLPGDLIATGTINGVGSIVEGDEIVAEIEGLGELTAHVSRSMRENKWHISDFPQLYAHFRDTGTADKGEDVIAPKKSEEQ